MAESALITSLSGKVPMVGAVRDALYRFDRGAKLYGADANRDCVGRFFVDDFWQMPCDSDLLIDDVASWCNQHRVRVIIPSRDVELPFWASHKEFLKGVGVSVMVSDVEAVDCCIDKLAFYRHGNTLGFPVIPTYDSIDSTDIDCWVVKERYGSGSINPALRVTTGDLSQCADLMSVPIFQPFIEGREISADIYIRENGRVNGVVLRNRDLVVSGESQVSTTFKNPVLELLCAEFAKSLCLRGHVMFQLIVDRNENAHVIECNCRFGGASTLSVSAGLDSFFWFLSESAGINLDTIPVVLHRQPLRQIRHLSDMVMAA